MPDEAVFTLTIDEHRYWKGLSRQDMDIPQVLSELVDNAIAARGKDVDGELLPFLVEISIERTNGSVRLMVADNGVGMNASEITQGVFSPGGQGDTHGALNEHGFGLKNAMCMLTGNERPWYVETSDEDSAGIGVSHIVRGPFRAEMICEHTDRDNWGHMCAHASGDCGTRVYAETTYDFLSTAHGPSRVFDSLINRLIEHLGVTYRHLLQANGHNKLWIRWREVGEGVDPETVTWTEQRVTSIDIPFQQGAFQTDDIVIDGPDGPARATYRRGLLDDQALANRNGRPYPLSIYYRRNQATQGVDVVIHDRVILTSQLTEIWATDRHNDLNYFTGELILHGDKFRTINNKTGMDPHNPYWIGLLEALRSNRDFSPKKVTRQHDEADIKNEIKRLLENVVGGGVTREYVIWTGVKIDIHHKLPDDSIHVYEVKRSEAGPLDVYQLIMYWDGLVLNEQVSPALGRLVAKSIPDNVRRIIDAWNARTDVNGNSYVIEAKTVAEMIPTLRN